MTPGRKAQKILFSYTFNRRAMNMTAEESFRSIPRKDLLKIERLFLKAKAKGVTEPNHCSKCGHRHFKGDAAYRHWMLWLDRIQQTLEGRWLRSL